MDVEPRDVVRGALPPEFRVARDVVRVADDGCLPVLRAHRSIEVEAIQPRSRPVQHLARVLLVVGLDRVRMVEIEVGGDPGCVRLVLGDI